MDSHIIEVRAARMRRQGCWRSVRCAPGFLPTITQDCPLDGEGRRERSRRRRESGTIRAPVLASRSLISAASRFTSSQRRVWISLSRQPVSMSRRIAVTEARVSEPSASISCRTWPSRWNSSSVQEPLALLLLVLLHEAAGVGTVLAQAPGLREIEHLPDHLEDAVRLVGCVPVLVMQGGDVFPVYVVDRHLAEIGDHEFLHQPAAGLDRPRLAPDLDVLDQIPLGELGDGGHGRRLRGFGIGVFTGLDAGDDLGRLGAGLLRRDDAVPADRDALRLAARPGLDEVDLGARGYTRTPKPCSFRSQ